MRKSAVAATILATLSLAPLAANAGQKVHEKIKIVGNTAVASWDYTEGNILTLVSVVATENNYTDSSGSAPDAFVSLAISQSDLNTGNVLLTGVAYAEGPESFTFSIDRQLNVANLQVSNAIFQDDGSFTFFNVDMNLNWTATAAAEDMKSNDKTKEPGILVHSRFNGLFREAQAGGSVFGKNIPVYGGNNREFVGGSHPSTSAQLQFNRFGQQTITTVTP